MITEKLQIKLIGRNLLNPEIQQTQLIKDINTAVETEEVVLSYKKGAQLNLSLKYNF